MKKKLCNIVLLFVSISLLFGCSKKNNDIIDLSLIELENYYRLDETFIIIECSTNDIIKILVETRKKKVHLNYGYTFKTRDKGTVDVLVVDHCIDIFKYTDKKFKIIKPIQYPESLHTHTGDDNLSEFRTVLIKFDLKNNKILSVERGVPI